MAEQRYLLERVGPAAVVQLYADAFGTLTPAQKRLAWHLYEAALAGRGAGPQPLMIFDEVDQGVGGAVADAVGLRLKRLAAAAQVLVVTHSPQVAARAEAHWRIAKAGGADHVRTAVEVLSPADREEEIARMLAGAQITDAARAAARALMDA